MNNQVKWLQNNQTGMLLLVIIVLLLRSTDSNSQGIRTPIGSDPFRSSSGLANTSTNAVHAFTNTTKRADTLYASGTYQTAFHIYELLAELGDKYSQYRVAFMYEQAQGIEHNLLQAYAWSKEANRGWPRHSTSNRKSYS
ncbi:MAG: hypothetical protein PF483_01170 [Halothiobacillus sp.]|jgi:TPR repeat protein|nr:hypothetical protein [Halothiobacillus sp.]